MLIDILDALERILAQHPIAKSKTPSSCVLQGRLEAFEAVKLMIEATNHAYEQIAQMEPEAVVKKAA